MPERIPNKTVLYPSIKLKDERNFSLSAFFPFLFFFFFSDNIECVLNRRVTAICDLIKVVRNSNMHKEFTFEHERRTIRFVLLLGSEAEERARQAIWMTWRSELRISQAVYGFRCCWFSQKIYSSLGYNWTENKNPVDEETNLDFINLEETSLRFRSIELHIQQAYLAWNYLDEFFYDANKSKQMRRIFKRIKRMNKAALFDCGLSLFLSGFLLLFSFLNNCNLFLFFSSRWIEIYHRKYLITRVWSLWNKLTGKIFF